ncbi:hypothetical protein J3F84DRAFT_339740 [Trichoderma pleuroticola]
MYLLHLDACRVPLKRRLLRPGKSTSRDVIVALGIRHTHTRARKHASPLEIRSEEKKKKRLAAPDWTRRAARPSHHAVHQPFIAMPCEGAWCPCVLPSIGSRLRKSWLMIHTFSLPALLVSASSCLVRLWEIPYKTVDSASTPTPLPLPLPLPPLIETGHLQVMSCRSRWPHEAPPMPAHGSEAFADGPATVETDGAVARACRVSVLGKYCVLRTRTCTYEWRTLALAWLNTACLSACRCAAAEADGLCWC